MGTRLEFYVPEEIANGIIDISQSFNIDAQVVGYVESSETSKVSVKYSGETFVL